MPFIPHTESDIKSMLKTIGVDSIETLFEEVPENIRVHGLTDVADGINELDMTKLIKRITAEDSLDLNFIGAGAYQHHIPAAVWEITGRGEYLTSYTPYQAEASQGNLQLIFEFQTMIASLCGMEVSNASMYDGASALSEAILMAVRANRKAKSKKILIADTIHPHYVKVIHAITQYQNIEIVQIDFNAKKGFTGVEQLAEYDNDQFAAVVIPQPNFIGQLTEVDAITNWAHAHGALVIGMVNPTTLALINSPGDWGSIGADIVCGEGQPLGIPLASGGPYFGFMACKMKYVRQLPGRIVGKTTDEDGRDGYTLTLQAREQHIRRSKATSNICTNQGLMVTAATIYMSLLGPEGLKNVAIKSHQNTVKLVEYLSNIKGVKCVYPSNYLYEVVIELSVEAKFALEALSHHGIQGGYDMSVMNDCCKNLMLVCATEIFDDIDLQKYASALESVLTVVVQPEVLV